MQVSYSFTLTIYLIINWTLYHAEASSFSSWSDPNIYGKNPAIGDKEIANVGGINLWNGRTYKLDHTLKKGYISCNEVFILKWKGEEYGRAFKTKCLKGWVKRNTYHVFTLLLIGGSDDEFCIFSYTGEEYYHKVKGTWTKVALNGEGITESKITSTKEIAELTESIKRWEKILIQHVKVLLDLNTKQSLLKEALSQELFKINAMKTEEAAKLKERLANVINPETKAQIHLKNNNDVVVDMSKLGVEFQDALIMEADLIKQKEHDVSAKQSELEQEFKQKEHELDDMKNQAISKHDHAFMETFNQLGQEIERFANELNKAMSQELNLKPLH